MTVSGFEHGRMMVSGENARAHMHRTVMDMGMGHQGMGYNHQRTEETSNQNINNDKHHMSGGMTGMTNQTNNDHSKNTHESGMKNQNTETFNEFEKEFE